MTINGKLLIGAFILVATSGLSALAQDSSGNGYTPMVPPTPASSEWREKFVGPSAPAKPGSPSRPSTWPNGEAPGQRVPTSMGSLPPGELHACEGAQKWGGVGQELILASEILPSVNEYCLRNKDRIPPAELEAQRNVLIRQALQKRIETLLINQDAKRNIPSEGWTHVQTQLEKMFEEQELDKMIRQSAVSSRSELDQKLRALGSSVDKMKRSFCEHELARQWVAQQIKINEEVTYDQMVTYYRKHQEEFSQPARAKWEELTVNYARYPTKEAAYRAIAQLGNDVLGGARLAEVAKAHSDGVSAATGGRRDWTRKGSLVCKAIDDALFTLPIGQLSRIIEGPTGFHIIRVTQREDASVTEFLEAQVEIRTKIIEQRRRTQIAEYMGKLKARTPVWTIFDSQRAEEQMANPPYPAAYRR